jgi:plastocyanin/cytochrome c556
MPLSERGRRAAWWRGAALLAASAACLCAFASSGSSAQEQPSSGAALMKNLSDRFRALEKALGERDAAEVARATAQLRELAPGLSTLRPQTNVAYADEFAQRAQRFGELVAEIAELDTQTRFDGAEQAFRELRATCVACHVAFRANNAERGDHPASANTVTGVVELRDADGDLRDDRAWVLVFLESSHATAPCPNLRSDPKVTQSGRQFHPRVLPVTVGTRVEFPNDDTIFHNVFSLSKAAPFDLGVYEPGHSKSVLMQSTGLVKVYCNIHPDMAASIVVLANPWYALTDRSGRFVVCDVPDGDYTLRAWNDMGAESRQAISVAGGRVVEANIALAETTRSFDHNNKYGKPYTGKYR